MHPRSLSLLLIGWLAHWLVAGAVAAPDVARFTAQTAAGTTTVEFWSEHVVRVTHRPAGADGAGTASLSVIAPARPVAVRSERHGARLTLADDAVVVELDERTGRVRFRHPDGKPWLAESGAGTGFVPTTVGPLRAFRVTQSFHLAAGEGIYGLGQHATGSLSYRGRAVHLQQKNRSVALPVLVSSRGYGLLWDNPAVTDVDVGKTRADRLTWDSEVGTAADYYFFAGPSLDQVVAGYRALTGAAPMLPRWAFGLWQSREHYETQAQLLGVVAQYRRLGIPLDAIVQDWQYWKAGGWGSDRFDRTRYPHPAAMVREVHREHAHFLISVWARFDPGLDTTAALARAGALYPKTYPNVYPRGFGRWYDPFNPAGRRLYWHFLSRRLLTLGVDGWWLDASEPELGGDWGEFRQVMTGAGLGATVFNAYPLLHTTAVYQGQRAETSAKRVVILTRSAYAGQQRNAAITWSGDTRGTWAVFRQQIPAGLNFSISGIPYWNTDIGGFFGGDPASPGYAELFTRWFQFATFNPIFRIHGTGKPKEIWRFPPATQRVLIAFDRLRYRLLPYIYSVAWRVTHDGDTMLRPLPMDFPADPAVRDIGDEFLFGPAILVCPVTTAGATSRRVYLPAGGGWTDFWTGQRVGAGKTIDAPAPIDRLPLYVRAGAIMPMGPDITYTGEKPAAPLALHVWPGADGSFVLYEDQGDSYAYEKGAYATIPLHWDERTQTLEIGARSGRFPGLVRHREFRVVWPDRTTVTVSYDGRPVRVSRPRS